MVMIIGHRGAAGTEPENTMRSFERAVQLGVDMIELDVHLSRDGYLVVIHDDTVDRTTDGHGKVSELDLDEIRELDAGSGERVPILGEVMNKFRGRCKMNIELKGPGTSVLVLSLLREMVEGKSWEKNDLLVSSFDPRELLSFSEGGPEFPKAFLADTRPYGSEDFAREIGCCAIHPNILYLEQDFMTLCREAGLAVNVWTVNSHDDVLRSLGLGADGIITDLPGAVRGFVRELEGDRNG